MFYENNGNAANDLISGKAGEYQFCRYCKKYKSCSHKYGKLTARTKYVLSYIYEHANGNTAFPLPGSWEHQPQWFIAMFNAGKARLSQCQSENSKREIESAKRR